MTARQSYSAQEMDRLKTWFLQASPSQLQQWQQEDSSLPRSERQPRTACYRRRVIEFISFTGKRCCVTIDNLSGPIHAGDVRSIEQLVLPRSCQGVALHLGHDVPVPGHLSIKKTRSWMLQRYYVLARDFQGCGHPL